MSPDRIPPLSCPDRFTPSRCMADTCRSTGVCDEVRSVDWVDAEEATDPDPMGWGMHDEDEGDPPAPERTTGWGGMPEWGDY